MKIDAGTITSERTCEESDGIGERVPFSNPTKRNGCEQRQYAKLDILPRRILSGDPAGMAFAIEAVRAFIAALAAE